MAHFTKLAQGTYSLKEISAPSGDRIDNIIRYLSVGRDGRIRLLGSVRYGGAEPEIILNNTGGSENPGTVESGESGTPRENNENN